MMAASNTKESGSVDEERDVESVEDTLLRVASDARCFRSMDGRLHARLPVADRHETFEIDSLEFGDWLIERYRAERNGLPPAAAVARVMRAVAARARFAGGTPSLHVRVGREADSGSGSALPGDDFYLDLGGRAVRRSRSARGGGWSWIGRRCSLIDRGGCCRCLRPRAAARSRRCGGMST